MAENINMKQFLDLRGLNTFWNKIKSTFADKQSVDSAVGALGSRITSLSGNVSLLSSEISNVKESIKDITGFEPIVVNNYLEALGIVDSVKPTRIIEVLNDYTLAGNVYKSGFYIVTNNKTLQYIELTPGRDFSSEIEAVVNRVSALETRVDNLSNDVQNVANSAVTKTELNNAISDLATKTEVSNINAAVNDVQQSVSGLETTVTELDQNLTNLESDINNAQQSVSGLADNVNTISEKVDSYEDSINTIETNIELIDDSVKAVEDKVKAVEDTVNSKVDEINVAVKKAEDAASRVEDLTHNSVTTSDLDVLRSELIYNITNATSNLAKKEDVTNEISENVSIVKHEVLQEVENTYVKIGDIDTEIDPEKVETIVINSEVLRATNKDIANVVVSKITVDTELELHTAAEIGGRIKLLSDITVHKPISVIEDMVIDLNGYNITADVWEEDGESNSYAFWVKGGKLTLNGNGSVSASDAIYSMAVWANGGDVEINGGTYTNGGDSCDLIYASKLGNILINNGTFIPAGPASGNAPGTKNPYSALNIKDSNKSTCSISVRGGKFFGFDPADNLSENPKISFVAEGYKSIPEGDWFVVKPI